MKEIVELLPVIPIDALKHRSITTLIVAFQTTTMENRYIDETVLIPLVKLSGFNLQHRSSSSAYGA